MANPYDDVVASMKTDRPGAAPGGANPYDGVLDDIQIEQQKRTRYVFEKALSVNPDAAAEAKKLANQTGLAPDVVARNLDEVRRKEQARMLDLARMAEASPVLARQLADPEFTKQAHDDIGTLTQIAQFFKDTGNSMKAGVLNANKGAAGVLRAGTELIAPILDPLESVTSIGGNPLRRLSEGFAANAAQSDAAAKAVAPKTQGNISSGFQSGVQSLTQNLLALPLAFMPGGQTAALSMMTASTGGQSYQDARAKGLSMAQSLPYAASQATVEYVTEKLPLGQLIGDIKKTTPIIKTLAKQMGLEIPGEQVATILQDLNDWAVLNPEKSFRSYIEERPDAAVQTLVATIVGTGGNVAVSKGIETATRKLMGDAYDAGTSEQAAEMLKQQLATATQSKLRERNPEEFRNLMQRMAEGTEGAPAEVFIDAEVLNQLAPEILQQLPQNVRDQLPDALAANDVVGIQVGDVLTIAPGTELEQMLVDNARVGDPRAMTRTEAQQAGDQAQQYLATEAQRVIEQANDQQAMQDSADRVKQSLLDQLNTAGRFRNDVNEAYATWTTAFYTTMAGRLGLNPEEMAARYPLKIAAQSEQAGAQLEQAAFHGSPYKFDKFSLDHLGKGEGAQAYGWGLYFAGNRSVAEFYKNALSIRKVDVRVNGKRVPGTVIARHVDTVARQNGRAPTKDEVVANMVDRVEAIDKLSSIGFRPSSLDLAAKVELQQAIKKLEKAKSFDVEFDSADGQLYEVNIPEDNTMLLWDKPLAEQSEKVQAAVNAVAAEYADALGDSDLNQSIADNESGNAFYRLLKRVTGSDKNASRDLNRHGVSGIKYLDGASRSDGYGNYNYVVFDDNAVSILNTYYQTANQTKARATFNPATLELVLNANANLSSYLHETGHFFLEVMADLANQPNAPAEIADDMNKLLAWFGVTGDENVGGPDAGVELGQSVTPDTIEVDGAQRSTTNSNGKLIAQTEEGLRNFWRWFDDSQVVDLNDRPLDFGGFYIKRSENIISTKNRKYLSDSFNLGRAVKDGVASEESLPDWFIADDWENRKLNHAKNVFYEAGKRGLKQPRMVIGMRYGKSPDVVSVNHADGHSEDGVSVIGYMGEGGGFAEYGGDVFSLMAMKGRDIHLVAGYEHPFRLGSDREELVVYPADLGKYDPTQIKSAIGNSGAFDPNDQSILAQTGDENVGGPDAGGSSELGQSDAFAKWFGDSKVVDADGKPLVVYHGTNKKFSSFKSEKIGTGADAELGGVGFSGKGFYFTPHQGEAKKFGKHVVAAYVTLKTPLIVPPYKSTRVFASEILGYNVSGEDLQEALIRAGYDGVIAQDPWTPEYIAFDPTQIKSATGNSGAFDPNDPSILAQDGEAATNQPITLKRTPLETWMAMTLDQKRKYHERFAESMEQYLLEGKAPSVELQPLFRKFRAWMLNVYKSLKQFVSMHPESGIVLSDEIRQVFDRMVASAEQIAQAEESAGLLPDENATDDAIEKLTARSLRDLKWTVNARAKEIKKLQKQAAEMRKGVEAEVRAEVEAMPVYAAQLSMRGENKLDIGALTEMYAGEGDRYALLDWKPLVDRKLAGKTGVHPDILADSFGYASGDAMVRAVLAAEPMKSVIQGMTDQRMLERHGDLIDDRAIAEAANEAVHNEARARSLATELKSQADMLNRREDTGTENAAGNRVTVNVIAEAAKQFAANVIARTPLRDLKSRAAQHVAAERRAGKRWQEATAAGKTQDAVKAKQDQVLNNAAAKAALEAQQEAKKIIEFFRRVVKDGNEKTVERGRDPDVVNAARAVLAAYGVAPRAGKSALEYMEIVQRNAPAMYAALNPSIQGALNSAQPLDALTMEELRGLNEEIQAMWHLSKRSRQMEVDGNLMDIEDAEDELKARMQEVGVPDAMPGQSGALTKREEAARKLQFAGSLLRRVESWAEAMDGKFGGPFLRLVFQPVKEAADRYRADRVAYRKAYQELIDKVAPYLKKGVIEAPELGYTFGRGHNGIGHAELLHAILHTGNDSNKRKLLLGREWATENPDGTLDTRRWDAFIERMQSAGTLTKEHYDFAQGVWDLLEQTKPLAQKTHRDVFGRYFAEVTANEVTTPFGTYRGGYVPAQADPRIVLDADMRKLAEAENENMAFSFPTTNKGFTQSRVDYNRPLMLDLRSIGQHLDKVLLFAHMEPAVRDVQKLLTRKGVSYQLGRIDPTIFAGMLTPWLNRSARQTVETPVVGDGGLNRILSVARNRAGMALMFANVSNTLQQLTGFSLAAVKVKPSHMMRATAQMISSPRKTSKAVSEASAFMANRMENEISAINDAMDQILLDPSLYEKSQAWAQKHAYFLQTAMAASMEPIIWTGAYNQALSEKMSEKDAVRFADNVIRTTQGSTLPEDVSRMETGPSYARAFTQFVGYFNMMANTNATALQQLAREVGLRKGAGKALGIVTLGFLAPIWVAEIIALAMRGGPKDEDDDGYLDDWLAAVFGIGTIKGTLAMVPFVGQLGNAAISRFNNNPADDRMSLSPAVSLLEATVGVPSDIYKAITDPDKLNARNAVRDVASAVSIVTGLPAYAIARPLGYLAGVEDDRINPTGPVDMARGIVTGIPSPQSK